MSIYDEILFPFEKPQQTYFFYKNAIPKRDKMVERSSVAICYVYRTGGASRTLEFAKKQNLKIINLVTEN